LVSAMLLYASRLLTKVMPKHIPGRLNGEADALSRREKGTNRVPPLSAVTNEWSRLQTCRVCLLPFSLLQEIAHICSSVKIEVTYEETMTRLMSLDYIILEHGAAPAGLESTIYKD